MKPATIATCVLALAASAAAQITEIPSMTVQTSSVDFDSLPLGATNLSAINSGGSPDRLNLAAVTLTPNASPLGFYNTNIPPAPSQTTNPPAQWTGRALALNTTGTMTVIQPLTEFTGFDLRLDLLAPTMEFGFSVGDWLDEMVVELELQGQPVGSILTSPFSDLEPRFFASGTAFDSITIRAPRTAGNWVLTGLHLQVTPPWETFGTGCVGSNGTPELQLNQSPQLGTVYRLTVIGLPIASGAWLMNTGFSESFATGFGALPFDLSPIGMPGCLMLCDVGATTVQIHSGSSDTFSLPIPNQPPLAGILFYNQAYVLDGGVNVFGGTTSNASRSQIQP